MVSSGADIVQTLQRVDIQYIYMLCTSQCRPHSVNSINTGTITPGESLMLG